ncbi:von Willebrand factor type A domain-containing protein [Pseudomonas sp. G34]|uniref:vWA domain-containing protein n=1 Tax=Pseudomonas sp. G34 TaxID=3059083 RepID=UPI002809196F|nr:von Willebrand factor type A domain-containing protein [Pseudomonas sp. G34]MDQ7984767.1 von Willebrand factor type A domain-containing protein [Pseudomonas sp. G34]
MNSRSPILLCGIAGGVALALAGCRVSQEPSLDSPSAESAASVQSLPAGPAIVPAPLMTRMAAPAARERWPAPPAAASREQYQRLAANPVQSVAEAPVSTFSIDVDTGSYANVRRFLNEGRLPPAEAVRLEELVNYFPYAYPLPTGNAPFGVGTELAVTPWNAQSRLLRVAIKASDMQVAQLPAANLVFLVDVSGSMDRPDGLPLVQSTLKLLVDQLRAQDRVSLVVYAGDASVLLEPTSGSRKAAIRAAIEQLRAGGSTAGESGIQLAYQQARKGFVKGGINRILLATDGDFNVGVSDFESLKALAADKRKSGISLTTLGFGTGNYNEQLMEQLADAGDGNYAYIDNLREARKVLVEQLSSTLATVARDVKIQVEFNPAKVSEYRLLGYENRALQREDFSNDKVDAGDIGAGHSVTALYEVVPVGNQGWLEPLRYRQAAQTPAGDSELAWLRIRYKTPEQNSSRLLETAIQAPASYAPVSNASEDLRFAAAVAAFAQQLGGGRYTGGFDWAATAALARGSRGDDPFGLRNEFVQLVELAQSLQTGDSRTSGAE